MPLSRANWHGWALPLIAERQYHPLLLKITPQLWVNLREMVTESARSVDFSIAFRAPIPVATFSQRLAVDEFVMDPHSSTVDEVVPPTRRAPNLIAKLSEGLLAHCSPPSATTVASRSSFSD
jgi:hypothetical protein